MEARRQRRVGRKAWDAWVDVSKCQHLERHVLAKMQRMVLCRDSALLRQTFSQFGQWHACVCLCHDRARVLAEARVLPLCRAVLQRWWWLRWRRHRHLIGLQSIYYKIVKKEKDLVQTAFGCLLEVWHQLQLLQVQRARRMRAFNGHVPCRRAWDVWVARLGWRAICRRALVLGGRRSRRELRVLAHKAVGCLQLWVTKARELAAASAAATWRLYLSLRKLLQTRFNMWLELLARKARRVTALAYSNAYQMEGTRRVFFLCFDALRSNRLCLLQRRAQQLFTAASHLLKKTSSQRDCRQVRSSLNNWRILCNLNHRLVCTYHTLATAHVRFLLRTVVARWHRQAAYRKLLLQRVCMHVLARAGPQLQRLSTCALLPAAAKRLVALDLSGAYVRAWRLLTKRRGLRLCLAHQGT